RSPEQLAGDRPHANWLGLALHLKLTEALEGEISVGEAMRARADRDLSRLRDVQDAGGEVGGVPDRRVVHAKVAADRAHDDQAGVDADPDTELDAVALTHGLAQRR